MPYLARPNKKGRGAEKRLCLNNFKGKSKLKTKDFSFIYNKIKFKTESFRLYNLYQIKPKG